MADIVRIHPYPELEWRYLAKQNQKHDSRWDDLAFDREWAMFQELPAHISVEAPERH